MLRPAWMSILLDTHFLLFILKKVKVELYIHYVYFENKFFNF